VSCCIHRHIIPGAVAGVVEVVVFGLSIYSIDSHIDDGIGRDIARAVVYRQCYDIPPEHCLTDHSIFCH
jgi:hypothetical protein